MCAKKAEEAKGDVKVRKNDLTVVAEDTNWRTYVAKEMQSQNDFNENWGFLTKAAQEGKQVSTTLEDRIRDAEQQMNDSSGKLYKTNNGCYGRATHLEVFNNATHNIEKSADLMPQPRRPKK